MNSITEALLCVLLAAPAAAAQRDAFTDGSGRLGPSFADVPGGRYLLGSSPEEPGYFPHERQRPVELSPFALTTHEITNDEFVHFLNERGGKDEQSLPWVPRREDVVFLEKKGMFSVRAGMGRKPVVSVSWRGARAYARWLSGKTGKRYELPTAAQWEAGARGSSRTAWWWGDRFEPGRTVSGSTALVDVGTLPPNGAGLYDTAGNAWEWTQDCLLLDSHAIAPRRDPSFFSADCGAPEVRGGSFRDGPEALRPGRRLNYWNFGPNDSVGFRLAREPYSVLPAVSATPSGRETPPLSEPGLELVLDMPPTDTPLSFMLFIPGEPVRHATGASTMRVPMPAGRNISFSVKEAGLGSSVERTLQIVNGGPTQVRLTGADFHLPPRGESSLTGRVLLSNHTPVKGALVVLEQYPYKDEVRTDERGFYRFKAVREGRHALLVDARNAQLPTDHPPVMLKRGELNDLSSVVMRSTRVPRLDNLGYSFPAAAVFDDDHGHWVKVFSISPWGDPDSNRLKIMGLPGPSNYTVWWAKSPLFVFTGGGHFDVPNPVVRMYAVGREHLNNLTISVVDADGRPVSVALYISSFAEDPDPFEIDTNDAGLTGLDSWVNVPSFFVWVDEAAGCFNGPVQIDTEARRASIRLSAPWTCYGDGITHSPLKPQ